MGSAIDALIARGATPPSVDPYGLEARQRMIQMGDVQAQKQQRQAAAQEIQQKQQIQQRDMASQSALMKAYQQANGDPEQTVQLATQSGQVLPDHLQKFQQGIATTAETLQKQKDAEFALTQRHTDEFNGHLKALEALPDDEARAAHWDGLIKQSLSEGAITKKQLDSGEIPQQYPGADGIQQLALGHMTMTQLVEREKQHREAVKAAADLAKTQADTTEAGATTAATTQKTQQAAHAAAIAELSPAMPAADYAAWLTRHPEEAKAGAPSVYDPPSIARYMESAVPIAERPKYEQETKTAAQLAAMKPEDWNKAVIAVTAGDKTGIAGRLASQVQFLVGQGRTKEADDLINKAGDQVNRTAGEVQAAREKAPISISVHDQEHAADMNASSGGAGAAQMAVDGRMDPQTLRAALRKNPGLLKDIQKLDPKFDEAAIDSRYNTLKEFTSSSNTKAGGQVLALNTLIHHADLYQQAADALKNGSFKPGNAAYNAVSGMMGSPAPQNAALVARFLAGETGKVATGGVPAEGEIKGILANLGTNASPEQIKGAGDTLLQVAAGRMIPLKEKAQQAKIDGIVPVLGADAKEILARRGYDPETLKRGGGVVTHRYNPETKKIEDVKQ